MGDPDEGINATDLASLLHMFEEAVTPPCTPTPTANHHPTQSTEALSPLTFTSKATVIGNKNKSVNVKAQIQPAVRSIVKPGISLLPHGLSPRAMMNVKQQPGVMKVSMPSVQSHSAPATNRSLIGSRTAFTVVPNTQNTRSLLLVNNPAQSNSTNKTQSSKIISVPASTQNKPSSSVSHPSVQLTKILSNNENPQPNRVVSVSVPGRKATMVAPHKVITITPASQTADVKSQPIKVEPQTTKIMTASQISVTKPEVIKFEHQTHNVITINPASQTSGVQSKPIKNEPQIHEVISVNQSASQTSDVKCDKVEPHKIITISPTSPNCYVKPEPITFTSVRSPRKPRRGRPVKVISIADYNERNRLKALQNKTNSPVVTKPQVNSLPSSPSQISTISPKPSTQSLLQAMLLDKTACILPSPGMGSVLQNKLVPLSVSTNPGWANNQTAPNSPQSNSIGSLGSKLPSIVPSRLTQSLPASPTPTPVKTFKEADHDYCEKDMLVEGDTLVHMNPSISNASALGVLSLSDFDAELLQGLNYPNEQCEQDNTGSNVEADGEFEVDENGNDTCTVSSSSLCLKDAEVGNKEILLHGSNSGPNGDQGGMSTVTFRVNGKELTSGGRRNRKYRKRTERDTSPVREDKTDFFDKIPSFYTALSIAKKPTRMSVFASTTKSLGTTDHLALHEKEGETVESGLFDKVPAHRRCFTNTAKDVDLNISTVPEGSDDLKNQHNQSSNELLTSSLLSSSSTELHPEEKNLKSHSSHRSRSKSHKKRKKHHKRERLVSVGSQSGKSQSRSRSPVSSPCKKGNRYRERLMSVGSIPDLHSPVSSPTKTGRPLRERLESVGSLPRSRSRSSSHHNSCSRSRSRSVASRGQSVVSNGRSCSSRSSSSGSSRSSSCGSSCSGCSRARSCSTCSSGSSRSRSGSPQTKRDWEIRGDRPHAVKDCSTTRHHSRRRSSRSVSPMSRAGWRSRSPRGSAHSRSSSTTPRDERALERKKWRQDEKIKAMEERRIVYVGKIPNHYTKKQLHKRFECFGEIKEVKLNFREHGDNYGFVTFHYACDAIAAKEKGNNLDGVPKFDLCFGGRRRFCPDEYADLDGNREIEEEYSPMPKSMSGELDYAALLKQYAGQKKGGGKS